MTLSVTRGECLPSIADELEVPHLSVEGGIHEIFWSGAVGRAGLAVTRNVDRIAGFSVDAFLRFRNPWIERAHPNAAARIERAYQLLVLTGTQFDEEFRWQRADGTYLWLHGRAGLRAGAELPIVDAVFADITSHRRLEEQVRQLQKMEAVGQFTGGIAHDFNNLLAVILANATMLLDVVDADAPCRPDAVSIMQTAERAAALTRQLLSFTRLSRFEPRIFDVNDAIRGGEDMLRRLTGEDVQFSFNLEPRVPQVRADVAAFEQVLMNLVVNARDAMPEGGKLSIATSVRTVERRDAAAVPPGRYVCIAVSDTGCGMDAETRRRIFEPFFTTKREGAGTGLGLSTCYGIVKQAGGGIAVDSEPGHGTVFEVLLPAAGDDQAVQAAEEPVRAADHTGTETILLVEDDNGVRSLVQRILERQGYRVVCARDALEAFAAAQAGPAIDLLLTDVVMPGPNGAEVARRVQAQSPRTRALLMSGHTTHWLLRNGGLQEGHAFIHKPFLPAALAKKVREVLDA